MKSLHVMIVLVLAVMFAGGCVAQQRADDLEKMNRALEEQVIELQTQLEESRARVAMLQDQARRRGTDPDMATALADAESQVKSLQQQLADAQQALRDAEDRLRGLPTNMSIALPEAIDSELKRLADQYPDLMTYDSQRGMVKLESDLTFALGSTDVGDQAKAALQRLADVLKRPELNNFEIRVIGHTDNVPVRNPANVRRYGDNWGLSAFRAIAVKDVLENDGLNPDQFMVGGYGEYHPIVPNGSRGARENRRVEIYIVPMGQPAQGAQQRRSQPAESVQETTQPENEALYK